MYYSRKIRLSLEIIYSVSEKLHLAVGEAFSGVSVGAAFPGVVVSESFPWWWWWWFKLLPSVTVGELLHVVALGELLISVIEGELLQVVHWMRCSLLCDQMNCSLFCLYVVIGKLAGQSITTHCYSSSKLEARTRLESA